MIHEHHARRQSLGRRQILQCLTYAHGLAKGRGPNCSDHDFLNSKAVSCMGATETREASA